MTHYYTSGTTTPWEHVPSSDATATHLYLDAWQVWTRLFDGLPVFIVLPPLHTPGEGDIGHHSLAFALRAKEFSTRLK